MKEGDKVAILLPDPEKQEVHLHPVRSVAELTFGALSPRKQPEDFRALREAFKEEAFKNDARCVSKLRRRVSN